MEEVKYLPTLGLSFLEVIRYKCLYPVVPLTGMSGSGGFGGMDNMSNVGNFGGRDMGPVGRMGGECVYLLILGYDSVNIETFKVTSFSSRVQTCTGLEWLEWTGTLATVTCQ